ncbi:MAG: MoaD/ThiS family protein [Mogibacterium sp.]|nr:MoaD/ThiS family protein [Mogibacterium sp.]
MIVEVTLRYLTGVTVQRTTMEDVPEGCTAGALCAAVIRAEEAREGLSFEGAEVLTLVNGRVVSEDCVLQEGDAVRILPVASGG